jgi:hypothetical protein
MIWFDRSTYVFRVIVVVPVGSHPLTYKVATKAHFWEVASRTTGR